MTTEKLGADATTSSSYLKYVLIIPCIILYGSQMWLRTSFMPLTEALEAEYGATAQDISQLASAFFMSYTFTQIPCGLLLQVVSSEISLIIPSMIAGLCSMLIYASTSFRQLILIRVLIGLSCSSCWLATLAIIQQYFSIYHVPFYAGIALLFGQAGPIASVYQAWLYEHHKEWRTPFLWMGIFVQVLCVMILITFIIDRRSITQPVILIMHKNEMQTIKPVDFPCWKRWLLTRPRVLQLYQNQQQQVPSRSNSKVTDSETCIAMTENGENGNDQTTAVGEMEKKDTLSHKVMAVLMNPYNYLFALLHSCLCAPQAILGALWLKPYLVTKFKTSALQIDETMACDIAVSTNIGAAISSWIFGYVGRKLQKRKAYVYRWLIMFGFVLWSSTLFIIYIPAQYHTYWDLFVSAMISGAGMGAISIVFAGVRRVNHATNSADLASGLVSTLCMAAMYVAYEVTGMLFSMVHSENDKDRTEQEYNLVFYYVVCSIVVGIFASFLIPPNK